MSNVGRGRGYAGKQRSKEMRPGDTTSSEDQDPGFKLSRLRTIVADIITNDATKQTPIRSEQENNHRDSVESVQESISEDPRSIQDLLCINEQYRPLVLLLDEFSPGEDGIQFNQKLKGFESALSALCTDDAKLHDAFAAFRAAALANAATAGKLAAVGASFTRNQARQTYRAALLNIVMQGTYAEIDLLEMANKTYLINAANLMGDYFAEARLANGDRVHVLAEPLMQYMRRLLRCDDMRAHRSLATQLIQNGRELLTILPQEIDDLSIAIRRRLITPPFVNPLWLLLSTDLCLNRFMPLPNNIQQFYASHLNVAPETNHVEVAYGSWKNKDRVDGTQKGAAIENQTCETPTISNHEIENKPKLRPILGAGAGLIKQEQALTASQDNTELWSRSNLSKRYDLNSWRQEEAIKESTKAYQANSENQNCNIPPNLSQIPNCYNYGNLQRSNSSNSSIDGAYRAGVNSNFTVNSSLQYGPNLQDLSVPPPNINNLQFTINNTDHNSVNTESLPPVVPVVYANTETLSKIDLSVPPPPIPTDFSKPPPNIVSYIPSATYQNFHSQDESVILAENHRPNQESIVEDSKASTPPLKRENWRSDEREESRKQKSWSRSSRESFEEDKKKISREKAGSRNGRRNSGDSFEKSRRHVSDVPRNHKYWDHDDRCDKDYNS